MTQYATSGKKMAGDRAVWLAVAVALVLALAALFATLAQPADAAVAKVGPTNAANGYPNWYQDSNRVRLGLCIGGRFCLATLPDPTKPGVVAANPAASNFPDESFWWAGEASIDRPGGGRALLVLAREAAFGGSDEAVRDGDQVSFSRVRIRVSNLRVGATYTVTHPYGVDTFVAENDGTGTNTGEINFTEDIGCALSPNPASPGCNFGDALFGRVDPFLVWNPAVSPAPPAGYVGNPNVGHRVVGSPNNTNFFRITGPDAGGKGTGVNTVQTSRFFVQGKLR